MATASVEVTPQVTPIYERVVLLGLRFKYVGVTKTVRSASLEVAGLSTEGVEVTPIDSSKKQPNSRWLTAQKELFSHPTLWAIWKADAEVAAKVDRYCLPTLVAGTRLLPKAAITKIDPIMVEHSINRPKLVEKFLEYYEAAIEAARPNLGALFDRADYPTVEVARTRFGFYWNYFSVSGANLAEVSQDIFAREQEKTASAWKELDSEVQQARRLVANDLVSTLIGKLTPVDGKKMGFRSDSLNAIKEFLATFDIFNDATNDAELKIVTEKIRNLVAGCNVDEIKGNEAARDNLKTGFEQIGTALSGMISPLPRRKVKFA